MAQQNREKNVDNDDKGNRNTLPILFPFQWLSEREHWEAEQRKLELCLICLFHQKNINFSSNIFGTQVYRLALLYGQKVNARVLSRSLPAHLHKLSLSDSLKLAFFY